MSAEDTLNDKQKRRRGLRRQAEVAPVEAVEVEDDLDEGDDEDDDSPRRSLSERKGRATRGRRTAEVEEAKHEGNFITRPLRGVRDYLEGVRSESQKIVWPTREDIRQLTVSVLVVTIAASIVLGIISVIFNWLISLGLTSPTITLIGLVLVLVVFGLYLRSANRRTSSF